MVRYDQLLCGFLFVCLSVTTAYGQQQDTEALDTITVTAQKREENVQDVPVAVSVFDGIQIEDRMIDTVEDIARYTPGLEVISYGKALKSSPSMRGLFSDYSTSSSTAGLFVDGVPVTSGVGFDQTLLDVERVEVLKGPQGTLYGKNTEVGAINIITRMPDNDLRARITVDVGEDDKREVACSVSGPLIEDYLYLGVAGKHYEKDGFVKNSFTGGIVDDREHDYGRFNLRWTPTERLEVALITSLVQYDDGASSSGLVSASDRKVSSDLDAYEHSDVWLSSLAIDYELSDQLSFKAITALRKYHSDLSNDFDYSSDASQQFHTFVDSTYDTLSQEFRVNYETGRMVLVSGLFYEQSESNVDRDRDAWWGFKNTSNTVDTKSLGVFSHLTYDLTDRLSLLAGLRFDDEQLEYRDSTQQIDLDSDEILPKLGLTYQLRENVMTYATIAKGYRSGGFNVYAPSGYDKTFDSESLYSYEVGIKGTAINGRLTWDMALYHMDISDMQVDVYIDAANVIKTNAAEATSQGVETSLNLRVIDGFDIFAGLSYNKTQFDKYDGGITDYSGKNTTFAPEYNFNLGALYRTGSGYYFSGDVSGFGDMYLDSNNDYERPAYELVNLKLGYENETFDIYFYAKNLLDKEYDMEGIYEGVYENYSSPREIGIFVSYRF